MCCGQTAGRVTPSLLSSAVPAGQAGQWKITYPSGNSRKFPTEWQAEASRAVGGGSIEFVPADEPTAAVEVVEVVEDTATTAAAVSSSTSTEEAAAGSEAPAPAPKPSPPKATTARKPAARAKKPAAASRKAPPKGSTSN